MSNMRTNVVIKTSFEAIHYWPDCPFEEVSFLCRPHRHVFHVTMKWPVNHNNRDKEFILAKREVEDFVLGKWNREDVGKMSCEDFCEALLIQFPTAVYVSVFEDNENGAEVYRG